MEPPPASPDGPWNRLSPPRLIPDAAVTQVRHVKSVSRDSVVRALSTLTASDIPSLWEARRKHFSNPFDNATINYKVRRRRTTIQPHLHPTL